MPISKLGAAQLIFRLEPAARAILDRHAEPGQWGRGRFIARLLYEFEAREDERQRLEQGPPQVLEEASVGAT